MCHLVALSASGIKSYIAFDMIGIYLASQCMSPRWHCCGVFDPCLWGWGVNHQFGKTEDIKMWSCAFNVALRIHEKHYKRQALSIMWWRVGGLYLHTLPGLLDSRAALSNPYPNALRAMQGGSLYHFYDCLWYNPAGSLRVIPKTIIKMVQTGSLHGTHCVRVGVWQCSPTV